MYDVAVIGSGPGGYSAAIRAGQLGLSVVCIEASADLGGTCLNIGCMPSKALLHASELYEAARLDFANLGIEVSPTLRLGQMMVQKDDSVRKLVKGVEFLFRKNKVDRLHGWGRLDGPGRVQVTADDGQVTLVEARHIVVATGSVVAPLPGVVFDGERIITSTEALSLPEPPGRLVIIGAGVIGMELGSVWRRLGSHVTVLEYQDRVLPGVDSEIAKVFEKQMLKQGMTLCLGVRVTGAEVWGDEVSVSFTAANSDAVEQITADRVMVAVGRLPFTDGLGLETVGLTPGAKGVLANQGSATLASNIWVIGDVTSGPMLAHKAEDEAIACIEAIAGLTVHGDHGVIPNVIYTRPEVATVGRTEEELQAAGVDYLAGRFQFMANSRARINHETEGMVKVLADKTSDRILGVHMVGPGVSEYVAEACLALSAGITSDVLARTSHPHPTRSEALRQAAMNVHGWAMQS